MIPNIVRNMKPELRELLGLEREWNGVETLIVVGPNASGKSLLRRLITVLCRKGKVEVIHLSQEGRSSSSCVTALVYGSEFEFATGYNSAGVLLNGFKTSRKREKEHVLLFDEPEIGLGEEAQLGAGEFLREQMDDKPPMLRGLAVMTHSRHIVEALKDLPKARFLDISGQYKTADEWLGRRLKPMSLRQIRDDGIRKLRRIAKLLK